MYAMQVKASSIMPYIQIYICFTKVGDIHRFVFNQNSIDLSQIKWNSRKFRLRRENPIGASYDLTN